MERVTIRRAGSYLYARAYLWLVALMTVVYAALAISLAAAAELAAVGGRQALLIAALATFPVLMLWVVYWIVLMAFKREARYSVELGDEGIREAFRGRERQFIPWAGVREIDLNATFMAGGSLRVKGAFSEIAISNVDLAIDRPMGLREIHRQVGRMNRISELFAEIKSAAPEAEVRMNGLARRRFKEHMKSGVQSP